MLLPSLIYVLVNWSDPVALRGWAIPAATDIAFALAILRLAGPFVPVSLKVFLTALAVLDDLGAVAIIAVFYASDLSMSALGLAALVLAVLIGLNRLGVMRLLPYLVLGLVLWGLVLNSGVHATLAGVALGLVIPARRPGRFSHGSPLHRLEHALSPWVAFGIVPVFGLANAGVAFGALDRAALYGSVPVGIALGLFLGKQVGVYAACWLAVRAGWAMLPSGSNWLQLSGVAFLCGIGFTMSLFIGALAFPGSPELGDGVKVGVLAGSVLSAAAAWIVLRRSVSEASARPDARRDAPSAQSADG